MRSSLTLILVLAVGLVAGFLVNHYFVKSALYDPVAKLELIKNEQNHAGKNTSGLSNSEPAQSTTENSNNAPASPSNTREISATITGDPPSESSSFEVRFQEEQIARQALQQEIAALRDSVQSLENRVANAETVSDNNNARRVRSNRIEAEQLINAGFGVDKATDIVRRWNQRELDFLYTRDKATRENWLDTDRYQTEIAELRNIDDVFQAELGDQDYDRFLYALGRENRLRIETVLENSAASSLGLEPGDRILRYDDKRVYSIRQLNNETSKGVAEEPVSLVVERGNNQVQLYIPRGPIGVSLVGVSVKPVG